MKMTFADVSPLANPSATEFMVWLSCGALLVAIIAFVAMAFNQLGKAKDRIAGKQEGTVPQPLEIRGVTEFAKKSELERHSEWDLKEHEKLWSKVGGVERGAGDKISGEIKSLRDERHDDAVEMQKRLSAFEKSIGGLEAATNLQNQSLASIQGQINRLVAKSLENK